MKVLTKELMMKAAGCQDLEKCHSITMNDMGLTELKADILSQLVMVNTLDLSMNNLTSFPDIKLKKLQTLDISENELTDIDFIVNFPNLQELHIEGNKGFGPFICLFKWEKEVIALMLCPSILKVNNVPVKEIRRMKDNLINKWIIQMEVKFYVMFTEIYSDRIPKDEVDGVITSFQDGIKKDPLFSNATDREMEVLMKFAEEIVKNHGKSRQGTSVLHSPGSSSNTPRSTRSAGGLNQNCTKSPRSARIAGRIKTNGTDSPSWSPFMSDFVVETKYRMSGSPAVRTSTPLTSGNGTVSSNQKKRKRTDSPDSEQSISNKRERLKSPIKPIFTSLREKLPSLPDYDPVFFIRCHSTMNDPCDQETKVWKCAMEPDVNNPGQTTNMLVTCGGQTVCLIDCKTGKVMKRYKDLNKNECFYTLAWTTLSVEVSDKEENTNILAVAGQTGEVKLLHPSQFVMYATLDGHRNYVSGLTFHPEQPTLLFSGSRDGKVIMWDIGVPNLKDYSVEYRKLQVLQTPGTDALNLSINSASQTLLAACEDSCYGWKLNNLKKVSREPDFLFILPDVQGNMMKGKKKKQDLQTVDGLVDLNNGFVATKCVFDGIITVWNVKDNLPKKGSKSQVKVIVKPTAYLQYVNSEVDYINLGAVDGTLCVGDDKGSLYLYNISKLPDQSNTSMEPSLILDWPEITANTDSAKMNGSLHSENIVINSACLSYDSQILACGTDNNMVCIWKRTSSINS
ncbi:hypothetical protein FSP39_013679 [Pinctada imbricata]|uniref:Leucine-rich repeat and WD repeat-containing protein 1 n=1 Tax=Pinctada imbricata TaxID=66713 RepID=A0AA88XFL5_PINIB|nr:hypothetical protein FSP39_013679 [Pinctada imbricata]